jgi:hypothetical protein
MIYGYQVRDILQIRKTDLSLVTLQVPVVIRVLVRSPFRIRARSLINLVVRLRIDVISLTTDS